MGQTDTKLVEANALKQAILKRSLSEVKQMITKGVNVDGLDYEGNTPLLHAVTTGDLKLVEYLIRSKANVCKKSKNGTTPLLSAVQKGKLDVIKLLLENGADETIQSAFFEAIILKNVEVVTLLMQHHAVFLNVVYNDDHTPLTKAIEVENLDIIKILVENRADVNMPRRDGTTPLTLSLQIGNLDIAKYLIENKANFQEKDSDLLLKYIGTKNFKMVQLLIELGVKLNTFYEDGGTKDTPLMQAVKMESFEIVKYLIEKGADVNQVGSNGKVPLAVAATLGDIRIVKFLIRSDARLVLAKEELKQCATMDNDIAVYLQVVSRINDGGINREKLFKGVSETCNGLHQS